MGTGTQMVGFLAIMARSFVLFRPIGDEWKYWKKLIGTQNFKNNIRRCKGRNGYMEEKSWTRSKSVTYTTSHL